MSQIEELRNPFGFFFAKNGQFIEKWLQTITRLGILKT